MLKGKGECKGAERQGHLLESERARASEPNTRNKIEKCSLLFSSPNARARTPKAKYLKAIFVFVVCILFRVVGGGFIERGGRRANGESPRKERKEKGLASVGERRRQSLSSFFSRRVRILSCPASVLFAVSTAPSSPLEVLLNTHSRAHLGFGCRERREREREREEEEEIERERAGESESRREARRNCFFQLGPTRSARGPRALVGFLLAPCERFRGHSFVGREREGERERKREPLFLSVLCLLPSKRMEVGFAALNPSLASLRQREPSLSLSLCPRFRERERERDNALSFARNRGGKERGRKENTRETEETTHLSNERERELQRKL